MKNVVTAWVRAVVMACAVVLGGTGARAEGPLVRGVSAISITVDDMDRALAFYTGVLEFELVGEEEVSGEAWEALTGVFGCRMRIATLRLGEERVKLVDYLAPRSRKIDDDARANDQEFQHIAIVVSDMDRAYAHLRAHRVEHASTGPQTLPLTNPDAGGIRAFYFRDPDGHFLEAIWFPAGKGDPRWQAPSERLFRGIDHTAIVVESTERSLKWYRDVLGLRVAGTSMNEGTEQAHLNNVEGARLRITGLRAERGPGVELLEYLSPEETRASRGDARASDLAAWCVWFEVKDASAISMIEDGMGRTGLARLVSRVNSPADADDGSATAKRMLRDADGHAFAVTATGG